MPGDTFGVEDLIRSADQALYKAKASGRNQTQADCELAMTTAFV